MTQEGNIADEAIHEVAVDSQVSDMFEDYRAAFDDFDADMIADCFAYPSTIWQFGKGNVFADEEELLENIETLLDVLDKEGAVRSEYAIAAALVSGDTALVTLNWSQVDASDEPVLEFTCHYHLLFDGDAWRIAMIVNEP